MNTKLLRLLEDDCTLSVAQLAAAAHMTEEEVKAEVKAMEDERVILGYKAIVDWDRTNVESVTALIEVKVTPQRGDGFDRIAERIYQYDEVESVYLIILINALGNAVKTVPALRGYLDLDEGGDRFHIGSVPVHNGLISQNDPLIFHDFDLCLHFLLGHIGSSSQLGGVQGAVVLQQSKQLGIHKNSSFGVIVFLIISATDKKGK